MKKIKQLSAITAAVMMLTTPAVQTMTGAVTAASADQYEVITEQDFLEKCGSRYGYDYLGSLPNGEKLQQAYEDILAISEQLWLDDTAEIYDTEENDTEILDMIDIKGLTEREGYLVEDIFRADNPIFFYLADFDAYCDDEVSELTVRIRDDYCSAEKRTDVQERLKDFIISTASAADGKTTKFDTALALHDELISRVDYAFDENGDVKEDQQVHTAAGAVEGAELVCDGYAYTYKILMNFVGAECYYVTSPMESHSWNSVRLDDGKIYYVDVTWDDRGNYADYYCFAKGTDTLVEGHQPDTSGDYPELEALPVPEKEDYPDAVFPEYVQPGEFAAACCDWYGYDLLGKMENGDELQTYYTTLYQCCIDIWNDTTTDFSTIEKNEFGDAVYYSAELGSDVNADDVNLAVHLLEMDDPIFYYYQPMVYTLGSNNKTYLDMVIPPEYYRGARRAEIQEKIVSAIDELVLFAKENCSMYDRALTAHDALIDYVDYAYDENDEPSGELWAHNVTGLLTDRRVVCEGYSVIYKTMLNYLGIPNRIVFCPGIEHQWNEVMLDDGNYYFVDCTWDDAGDTALRDYFAKGTISFAGDHLADNKENFMWCDTLPDVSDTDYIPEAVTTDYETTDDETTGSGDVNGDGTVNVSDVSLVAAYVKGKRELTPAQKKRADITAEGVVNVTDVSRLAAYLKGKAAL